MCLGSCQAWQAQLIQIKYFYKYLHHIIIKNIIYIIFLIILSSLYKSNISLKKLILFIFKDI
jgi:hypothetical protein